MGDRKRRERGKRLTDGSVSGHLVRLAWPMLIGIVAMMGFNMVDTFFVGRLGTLSLAAMAVTFPIVMIVTSLSLGLSVSTSIAVSRAMGRNDRTAVRRLTTDALSLGLVLAVVAGVVGLLFLDPLLEALEGEIPTHGLSVRYLRVWLCGLPFVVLPMVGNMAIRATGDTVTPSILIIVGVVVNALLDPLLIFGAGPVPAMGIAGAAWATVLARGGSFCAVVFILAFQRHMVVNPFVDVVHVFASWRLLLRNGVPIAVNNLITPIQMGAFTRMAASLGTASVAALGVATRVEAFGLTAVFALQSVLGIVVGQNAGVGKWPRVRAAARIGAGFSFLWGCLLFAFLAACGRGISALFNADPAVVNAAQWYYLVCGLTLGLRGVYLVTSAGLNALDRATDATVLTALHGLAVAVPLGWIGAVLFGIPGLFGGIAVGNFVGGVSTAAWLEKRIGEETDTGGIRT